MNFNQITQAVKENWNSPISYEELFTMKSLGLIRGTVRSFKPKNGGLFEVIVNITRPSKKEDSVTVIVPNTLLQQNLTNGCRIEVIGEYISDNVYDELGVPSLKMFLRARDLNFLDESDNSNDQNLFFLEGEILKTFTQVTNKKRVLNLLLGVTTSSNKQNFSYIPCMVRKEISEPLFYSTEGTKIRIMGRLKSYKLFSNTVHQIAIDKVY